MTFIYGILRPAGNAAEVGARLIPDGIPASKIRSCSPSPDLALGLSTPDSLAEDAFDRQPLADGRFCLAGDLRIDNREEAASELSLSPDRMRQMADSELFLAAWARWKEAVVNHVIGGFALAIWDCRERHLHLIRDHVGERPLFFLEAPGIFAFASLPGTLRRTGDVEAGLDVDHLLQYFSLVPSDPQSSFFQKIKQLPPGHLGVFRDGHFSHRRYWHPLDAAAIRYGSNREYEEAIVDRFDAAVRARLRSPTRVGSQLSGGLDSSSVTASAALLMGRDCLTAFTAVPQKEFDGANPNGRFGDEGPAAARLAGMYPNIEHVLVEASSGDFLGSLEKMSSLTATPVFNPINQIWLDGMLDESQRRGIQVLLQGACGNATLSFGGLVGLSQLFREGKWIRLWQQVRTLRKNGFTSWRGAAYWAAGSCVPFAIRKRVSPELREFNFDLSPVHPDRAREQGLAEAAFLDCFASDGSVEMFRRKMFDFYDGGYFNAGASLGWGVSLRDPTQDKRVFEFCFAIPIEQYLAEGQNRSLVRRAMRGRLPKETLACTTRGLQGADWYLTMGKRRKEMEEELRLISLSPTAQYVLDLKRLKRLLDTWPTSGFERPEVNDSWHLALSRGLAAGNFIRRFE